jgi:hypothetical protein
MPLHRGRAPAWLFERMRLLAREMSLAIVANEGPAGLLRRVSDPVWFQAFGTVLGFDWHSSGVTTTACGALKEGLSGLADDVGVIVAGGKGKTSRRTPAEIEAAAARWSFDPAPFVRASKLSAKVDSAAVQDGYQVYHHSFLLTRDGAWSVVQQGMNENTGMARRYHWMNAGGFEEDPHAGVAGIAEQRVLNLVAGEAGNHRSVAVGLAREHPSKVSGEIARMRELSMPRHHWIRIADLDPKRLDRILLKSYEAQPKDFTELLGVSGVGAKGLRALSMVAELTYGEPASIRDPVSYAFAHGGKDGTPFPVDRSLYDTTIRSLESAVREARLGRTDKEKALRRLARIGDLEAD